jgi:trimeric autotransporter adhesin
MADQIVSWGGFDSKGTDGMGITGSLSVDGSTFISSSNATQLQVGNNSLFVSGSGNVGIGTTTPSASLDVFKNNAGNIQTGNDSVIVKGNNPRLKILGTSAGSSTGDGVIQFSTEDSGDRWVITGGGTFSIGAGWYNSNTSLFRITNSSGGNTASSIFLANADSDSRFALGFAGTNGTPLSGFTGTGKLYISSTGLATPSAMLQVKGSGTTSATTAFLVENANASGSMVVLDNGNVGIGTTAPSTLLHIVRSTNGEVFRIRDTSNINQDYIFETESTGTMYGLNIKNNFTGLSLLNISADQKIGIATNDPLSSLHINKSAANTYQLLVGNSNGLGLGSDAAGQQRHIIGSAYGNAATILSFTLGGFTTASDKMTILGSGNVGIGTTTPTSRLQVKGSGTTDATTAFLVENANASSSMVILDNGFVGIGTTNPTTKLSIIGNEYSFAAETVSDINFYTTPGVSRHFNFYNIRQDSDYNFKQNVGGILGTSTLIIKGNSGNVGIGTTTPSYTLDVSGSGNFTDNLTVTGSATISNILTLIPQDPLPTGSPTGSFAVSSSVPPKPYFYDGTVWNALY